MFFVYGRRRIKIKNAIDYVGGCTSCESIGLRFEVYRYYFHIFWIPVFPVGDMESIVTCTKCHKPNNYNPRVKDFESVTRTPIYLYSGLLLFLLFIASIIVGIINNSRDKTNFIANPKAGDVYLLHKEINDSTFYYFLRVARIRHDTVVVYPNMYQYFSYVSRLNDNDSFITQEYYYTKAELKELLNKGEINSVKRKYGDYEGFNRLKDFVPQ